MIGQKLSYYLERYATGAILPQEKLELQRLMQDPANTEIIQHILDAEWPRIEQSDLEFPKGVERLHKAVAEAIRQENQQTEAEKDPVKGKVGAVHRMHFLKRWRWAAAILLVGTAISVFVASERIELTNKNTLAKSDSFDIAPGANRALLAIGDSTINLSNHKSGITVGNAITYNDGERIADAGKMLTLSTPKGGQYQAVLPDGTKVWLNAASSIRFPSRFSEDRREVEISGEVYMEVVQNLKSPFSVKAVDALIQVLGTSFNINAYPEEENQKTTLVSGSVKVFGRNGRSDQDNRAVVLDPGQQAIVAGESIKVGKADVGGVLAWKNGMFNFEDADLPVLMHQIERWYDIEVKYDGKIPDIQFGGKVDRGVKISGIIRFLSNFGVNARLEGRTLIIKAS